MREKKIWQPVGRQSIPMLLYLTYWVRFPNGVEWVKQEPFMKSMLDDKLLALSKEHAHNFNWNDKFWDLRTKGEMYWKDRNNIEHHLKIEKTKRRTVWGTGKTKLGSVRKETA